MAVAMLGKNGKTVRFITDEGEQFQTSTVFLTGLLMGKSKSGFILLSRLPYNCAPDRFAKSPVYDPTGVFKGDAAKTLEPLKASVDVYSKEGQEKLKAPKQFEDKKVW
jgi:hypothetical protein